MTPEHTLVKDIAGFTRDPLGFVRYAWAWGENELSDSTGPRKWQRDVLNDIGVHLQRDNRFTPLNIAVSSGHGIGKSALIAMITHWAMSTCEDCRVVMTANTEAQLRTKTWPEVAKWVRLAINSNWFNVGATTISVDDKEHERLWRVDAIAWSENNTEAFAGLHNRGKRIVVIYDEASAISDKVWEVTEGALTDEKTEIIWIAFGNPTKNTGRFRECFGRMKHRWVRRQIDSRGIEGTNKQQLDKWVQDYGEDSDFVRVRVRGEFPRAGATQFIAGDVVAQARQRTISDAEVVREWLILSVDVARFGDDQTIIGTRQGAKLKILEKLRGADTMQTGMRVCYWMNQLRPRMTVIDGDGVGGGVVDYVNMTMKEWLKNNAPCRVDEFHGGSSPGDGFMYYNRRAEVWGKMRDWLATADIPDDPELEMDLTAPEYFFSAKNQIQLEKKEDMKKRGLSSPDAADMLAMTFSVYPAPQTRDELLLEQIRNTQDPLERHFMRLKEAEKRNKTGAANYWD